jgi:LysM repeat protein
MRYLFSLLFVFIFALTSHHSYADYVVSDSLKLEKIANKIFIRHQVAAFEDLTSIARQYGLAPRVILLYNPEIKRKALKIGQYIRIPYRDLTYQTIIYTVLPEDNLYRVSLKFNNSIDEIKKLNNLQSDDVQLGQQLIIYDKDSTDNADEIQGESFFYTETSARVINNSSRILSAYTVRGGETLFGIARQNQVAVDSLRSWNKLENDTITVGQVLEVPFLLNKPFEAVAIITPKSENKKQIDESAMAEIIPYAGTQKVALHRTIPRNTLVKVYYESTERFVEVRIIGKLPDIQANKKVDIKISEAACKKLGAVNALFPVILFYSLENEE